MVVEKMNAKLTPLVLNTRAMTSCMGTREKLFMLISQSVIRTYN
jgi:hypothetical protein